MLTWMVIALFALLTTFEYLTLLKHAAKGIRVLHLAMMGVSFAVLMLHSLGFSLPSPSIAIQHVIEAIFKLKG